MVKGSLGLLLGLLVAYAASTPSGETDPYVAGIEQWREQRESRLKSDTGWLTLAGLFWLEPGENSFGTDPSNMIVLPAGTAEAFAGVFRFEDGRVDVRMKPGVRATVGGEPIEARTLKSDAQSEPDVIALGDRLTMLVIQRGERFGIRLKDTRSRYREQFAGLAWFPIRESYRIVGRFVPYDPPRSVQVVDVTGNIQSETCPGKVIFELGGEEVSLEPVQSSDQLFFVFSDETSGKKTYGSGRFLYADPPEDGRVVLDFNKAYNPPCAFTPYSTCPLPTKANRLTVPVEAGELSYVHSPR